MTEPNNVSDIFGDVIYSYTRAQAIADGVLVDVTKTAKEAGFIWPVAITRSVWENCVALPDEEINRQTYQDESGRLWDVVWMAFLAIRKSRSQPEVIYELYRGPQDGNNIRPRIIKLKLVAGPGDNAEPVITIMLPNED